ncbi:hypothetical protein [Aminicella lysinilytica]|uniref:Uncharacterized protein n=1 Tax=Aminicella lysinilytica TaxID=433323 RepID=A0A4V6PUV8_9FIRM|nr:hypothetical protein [Aminicella lysinilytica]TDP43726.1 hypothetical protein EV211_1841 [Aminicella lysinilytica]
MDGNKRSTLKKYSVALMTTVSIIPGAFANMIFYTVNIIFILVFYAVVDCKTNFQFAKENSSRK